MTGPTLLVVRAPIDRVRSALVAIGASAQNHRSVVLDLGDQLILLEYDQAEAVTIVAVGGPNALPTASWLARQLDDFDCVVEALLPPRDQVGA